MDGYNTILYKTMYTDFDDWCNHWLEYSQFSIPFPEGVAKMVFRTMANQFNNCYICYDMPEAFWQDFATVYDTNAQALEKKQRVLSTLYEATLQELEGTGGETIVKEGTSHNTNTGVSKTADTPTQYEYTEDFIDKYVNNMGKDEGEQDTTYNSTDTHSRTAGLLDTANKIKYIRGNINEEIISLFAPLFMWFN